MRWAAGLEADGFAGCGENGPWAIQGPSGLKTAHVRHVLAEGRAGGSRGNIGRILRRNSGFEEPQAGRCQPASQLGRLVGLGRVEQHPQPLHGAEIAHPGGGLGQSEDLRSLCGGEMLKVAEQHDLAVGRIELLHGGGTPGFAFVPRSRGRRGEVAIDQMIDRIVRQCGVCGCPPDRLLPVEAAAGGQPVAAMGIYEPVAGHMTQPELEWHRGVGEIIAEAAVGFDHHILHDIAGIDPPLNHPVHPQMNHPLDRLPMAFQEAIDGGGIPAAGPVQQGDRDLRLGALSRSGAVGLRG